MNIRVLGLAALCLVAATLSPALAQQETIGGIFAKAIGNALKGATGSPSSTPQTVTVADAESLQDIDADGSYPIPAFNKNQAFARRGMLRSGGLGYEHIDEARGFGKYPLPAEYEAKLASVNHRNSFEERDFIMFAQPYVNWFENYLLRPEIFVSTSEVAAGFSQFSPQDNGFPVTVSLSRSPEQATNFVVNLTFGDKGNRDLEDIRSTDGIRVVAYVSQQHRNVYPFDFTLLALQLFNAKSGRSLVVTTFTDATPEQKNFIKANALKSFALTERTPMRPGSSPTSVAAGRVSVSHARVDSSLVPVVATAKKGCPEGEEALKTLKLTKVEGATRIDYLNIATQAKNWTNVMPDFLREKAVKVGSVFCIAP